VLLDQQTESEIVSLDVQRLEKVMLAEEQVDCAVIHRFSPGVYIREVHIPAGTVAVGHYQKTRHLNIFLQGSVTMFNEDGSRTDLTAPMIFTGEPGRKVGHIHEDLVWLNVYPTEETDIEILEGIYLDKSEAFLQSIPEINRVADIDDFNSAIDEIGIEMNTVKAQVEDELDQIPMPEGSYKFLISGSSIHGKGVFASAPIVEGELIGAARVDGMRTPIGRFTNHAKQPNAEMIRQGDDIYLSALRDIQGCKGGLNGEEITTDYRNNIMITKQVKLCQV